jgi:uncharacterized protein YuzE
MNIDYDKDADAIYIHIRNVPYSHGRDLDPERRIDYGVDGEPVGVELLCVSEGVITDDLPRRVEIEKLLAENHIKIYA